MVIVGSQFDRVAEAVTERTADLLSAPVTVVDERGLVVASSMPDLVGRPLDQSLDVEGEQYITMPLRLASRSGTVLIGRQENEEEISPRLATVLVELVINQTAVVDRLPNKHELKNKLIHDLLHGSIDDESSILREAQILGMDLGPPRVVILIDASQYIMAPGPEDSEPSESRVRQRAQLVIGSVVDFFHLPSDTICAYIGQGEVAVLKASNRKNLTAWVSDSDDPAPLGPSWANLDALKRAAQALLARLRATTRSPISVGIGRHHPGISGLARSYSDARAALSLGCRFHGANEVHCLDSLGIAAFVGVSDEQTKIDLATYLLSPLDHEPDLLITLDTFFQFDCLPVKTARALGIHRNTLSYRLDKIASLTGLDPRDFDEAVQIRLALLLRSFYGETA